MNKDTFDTNSNKDSLVNDPWKHRSKNMLCSCCMYFCNMRCRRHAPKMSGYPAVFTTDWCGDHKLAKEHMGGV